MTNQALKRAIDVVGSQEKLAKVTGAPQSSISFWLIASKRGVPGPWCKPIEIATGVPRHELRPDIFDAPEAQGTSEAAA